MHKVLLDARGALGWGTMNGQTMLIAYDGSERADRAIEYAAQLLRPGIVEILTAWEPAARQAARALGRTGLHQSTYALDDAEQEEDSAYKEAMAMCRRGVAVAEKLGLAGRAHLVEVVTTTAEALSDAAEELDVDVIVTGTRALTGFKAWWNASTADQLVRTAGRPVLVVPPEPDDPNDANYTDTAE